MRAFFNGATSTFGEVFKSVQDTFLWNFHQFLSDTAVAQIAENIDLE